jgi:hypothetical protein
MYALSVTGTRSRILFRQMAWVELTAIAFCPCISIAAVTMHLVNFISHVVASTAYSYSYTGIMQGQCVFVAFYCFGSSIKSMFVIDMSSWWNPTDVVLAVTITTAVLCFVLLAINVDRMKLSRNALDVIVNRFKKELASTIKQVATPPSSLIIDGEDDDMDSLTIGRVGQRSRTVSASREREILAHY